MLNSIRRIVGILFIVGALGLSSTAFVFCNGACAAAVNLYQINFSTAVSTAQTLPPADVNTVALAGAAQVASIYLLVLSLLVLAVLELVNPHFTKGVRRHA